MAFLRQLHRKVLFLGDKPSVRNVHPEVAFVGTRSYLTLLQWIHQMDLDIQQVTLANARNQYDQVNEQELRNVLKDRPLVVFLGKEAEDTFKKFIHRDFFGQPATFALPHPSGVNRRLNDRGALGKLLKECSQWIYSGAQG